MRGDRPRAHRANATPAVAAPHARGSTPPSRLGCGAALGCPACAGIDPRSQAGTIAAPRLPRMRGDRPVYPGDRVPSYQAAPHARGSTHRQTMAQQDLDGCPACAGIDPVGGRTALPRQRLPRMRGDRPPPPPALVASRVAAPHARGSTLPRDPFRPRGVGCPACAGIDPIRRRARPAFARLPRMRGDRPVGVAMSPLVNEAAPHARGSTPRVPRPPRALVGCPACAGIDPRQ